MICAISCFTDIFLETASYLPYRKFRIWYWLSTPLKFSAQIKTNMHHIVGCCEENLCPVFWTSIVERLVSRSTTSLFICYRVDQATQLITDNEARSASLVQYASTLFCITIEWIRTDLFCLQIKYSSWQRRRRPHLSLWVGELAERNNRHLLLNRTRNQ
jgi:hypothetical protein